MRAGAKVAYQGGYFVKYKNDTFANKDGDIDAEFWLYCNDDARAAPLVTEEKPAASPTGPPAPIITSGLDDSLINPSTIAIPNDIRQTPASGVIRK